MSFQLKGNIITLKKDKGESLEQYIKRGHFVVSNNPQNTKQYEEQETYSRIHINVNDNKSEYGPKVMNKLKEYEKNLYV